VRVGRTLIRSDVAPPEDRPSGLDPGRGHVAQAVHGGGARLVAERVIVLRVEDALLDPRYGPARLVAPAARRRLEERARRVPGAGGDGEPRPLPDAAGAPP